MHASARFQSFTSHARLCPRVQDLFSERTNFSSTHQQRFHMALALCLSFDSGNIDRHWVLLLVCSVFVVPCEGYVTWVYPSDNDTGLTFNYIDTVYFTWKSSISGPWMNLWCAPNHTSPQSSTFGKLTRCCCCYSDLVSGRKKSAQCVQNQKANQR